MSQPENFYQALIENAMEVIVVIGMDGKIRYVSPSGQKLMGYQPGENLGRNAFELIHPDDIDPLRRLFRKLIREPEIVLNTDFKMKHKDGTWRTVEGIGQRHTFSNETSPAIVVNYRDVTESRKSEREMSRLASIVESSNDAIYLMDLKGIILSWNHGGRLVYGYTAEEISGRSVHMLLAPGRVEEFERILETVKKGDAVNNFETLHKRKDGSEVLVSLTVSPLAEKSGEITRASIIARPVLEREQADAIRKALQLERDELLHRLQLQMENMPIAFILNDKQNRIIYLNPAAEKMFGYSLKEVSGKSPRGTFIPEFKWPVVEDIFEKLAQGDTSFKGIIGEGLHKEGRILHCEWYNTPLIDTEGRYSGHMVMALDVTERKKAEEMTAQYAAVAEYSDDAILGIDLNGNITSWNKGAERIYGYKAEEVLGKSSSICQPEDQKQDYKRFRELVLQGKFVANFETVRVRKSGLKFEASITVSPIRNAKGEVVGASAITRDISERKKAEEMMSQFAAVAQYSNDAIIGMNLQGIVTSWNKGAEKLYGYTAEEIIGKGSPPGAPDDLKEDHARIIGMVQKGEFLSDYETIRIHKNGQRIPVAITLSPIRNSQGVLTGLSAIIRDISERKKTEEMMARFAAVAEYSDDAITGVDLNGNITSWNKGAEKIYGYNAAEALGKSSSLCMPEDHTEDYNIFRGKILKGEFITNYETVRVNKEGRRINVSLTLSPIRNARGEIIGASSIARDISERKKAEEAQALLAAIAESTTDAITGSDLDGRITVWSSGAEKMYGWKPDEAIGKNISIIAPPGLDKELVEIREIIGRGNSLSNIETVRRRKDGRNVQVSLTLAPVRDSQGHVTGISAIARDISEKKKAEEMMARFAAVAMYSNDAIIGMDLEGNITGWNKGAERILGYPASMVVGINLTPYFPKEQKTADLDFLKRVKKGEVVSDYETVHVRQDGQKTDLVVTGSPIRDAQGNVTGISFIVRDVSERKKAEEELKKHEEQLRFTQKMDTIGRLAGGVAHDFNNLLSVIRGNTEYLLNSFPPEDNRREEMNEILKAVQRGAEMTKQLLVFGKKQIPNPQPLNLNDLSTEMERMLKRLIDANVNLAIIPGKDLDQIEADHGQIQEAILNLVLNACDAMPKGGHIIIETKNVAFAEAQRDSGLNILPGHYVRLNVTDTGKGMDRETRKHLFEPFFTTKKRKGSGLGLATVVGIVNRWKGHIALHSAPGLGCTFSIFFPAVGKKKEPEEKTKKTVLLHTGSETILLAEDEKPLRKIIARTLGSHGYRVLEAANGVEAMKKAGKYQKTIHLLLTDTIMPKMDGRELADELRKTHPGIKVIFISGYPRGILSQREVLKKGVHLIKKPFSMESLIRRIQSIVGKK